MPQSSTASILPIFNPELTKQSEPSGYNWKTLTKAGLVFVTTTGAFLTLKATGSFNLIASLWKNSPPNTDLDESSALANFNPSAQTYTAPVSEEQPFITHQYAKRQPANETVIKIGPEFQVNTYTISDQYWSSVAGLTDGKFIITWMSSVQDGDDYGIYGQLFNANGTKYASEFRVNTYTTSKQMNPSVAGLNDGKFIITWTSYLQDGDLSGVYGQIFDVDGTKLASEFQVNTYTTSYQGLPSAAKLNDGKFIITWESEGQDGNLYGIYGQLFNENGTKFASEFQVNTYTIDDQRVPSVSGLNDGKFVVTWRSNDQDGSNYGVYGQMFNANGTKFASEFQVNTYTVSTQESSSVAGLSNSKFVATWASDQDGSYGIYGQMFSANGTKFASEFQVNTYTTSSQQGPSLTGINDGKFIITWISIQDGDGWGIYGQLFNANGAKFASEFQVNTYTTSHQTDPAVAGLGDDKFVVIWESSGQDGDLDGIFSQLFKVDAAPTLINNNLTIGKGETVTLTTNDLSATDVDDDDTALIFNVSNSQHGQFELKSNPEAPITTFTQQQIIDGNIQFVHDGSDVAPTYRVSASDGWLTTDSELVTITCSGYMPIGSEFLASSCGNPELNPSVAGLSDGKFVAVWYGAGVCGGDPSGVVVCDQMFNANSSFYASRLKVNTYTTNDQSYPSVAKLSDGKFIVTWQSYGQDGDVNGIYGQMFNTDGSQYSSEFRVNTYTANHQSRPSVAGLNDGKFVVTWSGQDSDANGIYGQMFNVDGSKYSSEFRVNTYTAGIQAISSVTGLNNGKFVITWHSDGQDGGGYGIHGQMYNANGTKFLSEFQVNTYTALNQRSPSIAGLSDGKFVITWESAGQDGDSWGMYGQMFNADGSKFLLEFQVNTYTTGMQYESSVAGINDGKFVVTWQSLEQDGDSYGIYGQIFNADGSKYSSEFQVNTYTASLQTKPSIASLSDGKFVVMWQSDNQCNSNEHIYGQMFSVYNFIAINSTSSLSESIISSSFPSVTESISSNESKSEIVVSSSPSQSLQNETSASTSKSSTSESMISSSISSAKSEASSRISTSISSSEFGSSPKSKTLSSSPSITESALSGISKNVTSSTSLSVSQSATKSESSLSSESLRKSTISSSVSSATSEISSISEPSISNSLSSTKSEASSVVSTPLSSSEFSSENKTLSSSRSNIESTSTSSKTSKSKVPSSTPSVSQSTTQSKTSESISKSSSKEVSSTQAFSGSSNPATTTNKSLLGIILGSIGGIASTILAFFGAWLKYKKYKATSKMRRQNPLAAEIHNHLNLNISSFESEKGQKYLGVVKDIMGALGKRGVATDEMDQEALRTLTLRSVKVIEDKVKPKKSWIGRKQISVEDLENAKDSITKKIAKKCAKGKGKNEIALQIMDDEKKSSASPTKRSGKIDPSKLGKFEKIGQGAMGIVYKAKYHGSDVAVKQLPIIAADSEELKQFEQEAKLMKKSRHPHVVNFYGYYQDPTHYSIVMEYVSGGSLDEILYDTQQPFPWYPTRWDVAHDIASAVSFLHSNQIIHRDLKSQNVLVYYEQDRMRAKVADVGIAKIVKEEAISTMTKGMGTPLWMAPEVIEAQGEKKKITYDEKVDVYSYGIILSELINRKAPYSEVKNLFHIIPQVLDGNRPDFDEASAPAGFIALMQRCWAQRATERPKMQEVVDTLDQIEEEVRSFEC